MTTDVDPPIPPGEPARPIEMVLAHAHLRLGLLPLARAELEMASAQGDLDPPGLVDLAEVRWRSGDLAAAGRAAGTAIDSGAVDPLAWVIASEAAAADGRTGDARRYATQVLASGPESIDRIFAGMPRSTIWPPDSHEPLPLSPTLFDRAADPRPPPSTPAVSEGPVNPNVSGDPHAAPMTLGLWAGDEAADPAAATLPDPAEAFDSGRSALVEGAFDEAAFHLGLALRLAPALAPAVLEVTDGARARSLIVVRGDAYRMAGHEPEARQAYAVAARGGLPERRSRVRVKALPSAIEMTAVLRPAEPDDAIETTPADIDERTLALGPPAGLEPGQAIEIVAEAEPGPDEAPEPAAAEPEPFAPGPGSEAEPGSEADAESDSTDERL
jgi:hypothetical protein